MKLHLLFSVFLFSITSFAQTHKVSFETSLGTFKVVLYDFTPNHRDMFLNEIKNGTYNQAFFNRIIENFVVQGGEHDDDIALLEETIPLQNRQRLTPEFDYRAFHKIGALGAGRDDNEQKASFFNQIYFVVGKSVTEEDLNKWEQQKGISFTQEQRKEYVTNGGLPRLDNDYTVFGEIIEGLDVMMQLSKVITDHKDYPVQTIHFSVFIDE